MSRKELEQEYENKGITNCELKMTGCKEFMFLGLAHRHKRNYYKTRKELLWTFNQTILACSNCHDKIEYSRRLTEEKFRSLRGEEI